MANSLPMAVVGGGPAGALAAAQLAAGGRAVLLVEEKPGWEKPCGGGMTDKALRQFPFLDQAFPARNWVEQCELTSPSGRRVLLRLDRPVAIFSRQSLNGLLLERARQAGVEIITDRVVGLAAGAPGWQLQLRSGGARAAQALVIAAGARNPLRNQLSAALPPPGLPGAAASDWMATAGYYLPQERLPWPPERMAIRFLPGLEGYIWSFPRTDHASVGICGKLGGESTAVLRRRLEQFLEERGIEWRGSPFYSHLLPSPSPGSLARATFAGRAPHPWALAGDAAGLVDPITGEGLYYALRSAQLLAQAWSDNTPERYPAQLRAEIVPELESAARIAERFFHGRFLGDTVLERMALFSQRSPRFRQLMCDLFSGTQGYIGLRRRLYRNLVPALLQFAGGSTA